MHELDPIEHELRAEAERLSQKCQGAAVVMIVAGSEDPPVPRCMLGSTLHNRPRLRDLLGILETAKHVRLGALGKQMQQAPSTR